MKYLIIVLSIILSGCAAFEDQPVHNFYSYYHGYQVISDDSSDATKEIATGTAYQHGRFDPFEFAKEHHNDAN